MICHPGFLWGENGKKKAVLKFICIQFSPSGMLIPNLRAFIFMKLIYPANSHVEQQIASLPKWIECVQSNHHPAKGVQINLSWLLFLLLSSPQFPVPKSTHSILILFFFLRLNEMLAFPLKMVGRFSCFFSSGNIQTGVGKIYEPAWGSSVTLTVTCLTETLGRVTSSKDIFI